MESGWRVVVRKDTALQPLSFSTLAYRRVEPARGRADRVVVGESFKSSPNYIEDYWGRN
jgi:hypothetical protein